LAYSASAAASLGYALLPVLAVNCGLRRRVGIAAGLFGALLPINFWNQTSGVFEAPYTLLAFTVLACVVARHWEAEHFTLGTGVACGLAAAASILSNAGALPILVLWFVCAWIHFSASRAALLRYFAVVSLIVLAALAPWALRNRAQLGSLILTRSNFGLEFQLSNSSTATSDAELNMRSSGNSKLHPATDACQLELVRQMGEVAYNRAKLNEATGWIREHPGRFLELTLGRIALFWFPRMDRLSQTLVQGCLTLLAVCGIILLWRTRPVSAVFLGSACVAYSLVYVVIQVSPRYRFPIEGFLLLLGSYFVCRVGEGSALLLAQRFDGIPGHPRPGRLGAEDKTEGHGHSEGP